MNQTRKRLANQALEQHLRDNGIQAEDTTGWMESGDSLFCLVYVADEETGEAVPLDFTAIFKGDKLASAHLDY